MDKTQNRVPRAHLINCCQTCQICKINKLAIGTVTARGAIYG